MEKIEYTLAERDAIIARELEKGLVLVEDQISAKGNFLVFEALEEIPPEIEKPIERLEKRLGELEKRVDKLEQGGNHEPDKRRRTLPDNRRAVNDNQKAESGINAAADRGNKTEAQGGGKEKWPT